MTDQKTTQCFVCTEEFNRSLHEKVICPFNCGFEVCKECVRTYLLGSSIEPHCMQCKKIYDERFLVDNLNKSFINNAYKAHRKRLLLEGQLSRLPETMFHVDQYTVIQEHEKKIGEYNLEMRGLRDQTIKIDRLKRGLQQEIYNLRHGQLSKPTERQSFIMPCPSDDCRGFLSSAYKCEVCKYYTCSKCIQITGYTKDAPDHTCDQDMVATASLIKKETKPCPGCGERIQKTSGCDQMWCIKCHKAFSWKTGKIETGVVHNPHFYAHLRDGGPVVRNPNDVMCGGMPGWWRIRSTIAKYVRKLEMKVDRTGDGKALAAGEPLTILITSMGQLHQTLMHIQNVNIPLYRREVRQEADHTALRVQYILKNISEADLARTVYQDDRRRKKYLQLLHVFELLMSIGIDMFITIETHTNTLDAQPITTPTISNKNTAAEMVVHDMSSKNNILKYFTTELNKLVQVLSYCNNQLAIVSTTYSCVVPIITSTFTLKSTKFTNKNIVQSEFGETNPPPNLYPEGEGAV